MYLTHALRAILRTAVATGDALWKYVSLLLSGTPPTQTFIADASVNANVLTLNGDVRPSNLNPYVEGYYSNYFDGSGDWLAYSGGTTTTLSGDFTLECWVYVTSFPTNQPIICIGDDYSLGALFYIETTGKLGLFANNVQILLSAAAITTNNWNHVAYVRSGATITAYINGVARGTGTSSSQWSGATTHIGREVYNTGTGILLSGYLSNLRLVKGTAVYTANFTPPTAPLTAVSGTSLLTCQSNRFIDNSANNFAITRTGDVAVRGFVPFTPPTTVNVNTLYSTYFDGTGDYLTIPTNAAFGYGTGDFTIEFWMYPSNVAADQTVFSNLSSAGSVSPHFYILGGSNVLKYYTNSADRLSSAALSNNTWYHIALTRASGSTKLFVNGVQAGSAYADSNDYGASAPAGIGTYWSGGSPVTTLTFVGSITNVRTVKGTAVYTANFTPPTSNLTAISGTSLLTCQNATIIDNSTNAFVLTAYGQTKPLAVSPFGTTSYSQYFDGNGDYLTVPNNGAFDFSTGDFTVEAWVYTSGTQSQYANIVCQGSTAANAWYLSFGTSNTVTFSNFSTNFLVSSSGVANNTWTHVAVSRSGTSLKMFLNGAQAASATNSSTLGATATLFVGFNNGASYFNGNISNLRVVKGTAVYTANFTPSTTPLTAIANTSLLTCQNLTAIDNSANAFTITKYGDVSGSLSSPFPANVSTTTTPVTATYLGSGYFDGSGDTINLPTSTALLGAGNYTVEFWVNLPAAPTGGAYFTVFAWGSSGSVLRCFLLNETVTKLGVWIGATNVVLYPTSAMVGQWAHIALVRSGTTLTAYINGVSVATASDATNYNTGQLYIASQAATNFLTGYISNFHIVVGTAVYTANFAPPATPLTAVANTSLLTLQTDQPAANKQFVDNSGSNLIVTQAGNATQGSFSPYGANWSNYFGGQMASALSPASTNFNLTGDFTLEAWIYPISFPGGDWGVIDARASGGTASAWIFGCNGAGKLYFYTGSAILGATTITTNTWHHISWVRNGSVLRGYLDGVLDYYNGSFGTGAISPGSTSPVIGTKDYGISAAWGTTGYLSNVRVVNGTAIYTTASTTVGTTAFTPPTAPLTAVANTVLLTCQSSRFADNSNNNYAITPSSSTISAQRFSPFSPVIQAPVSYSTYFDGSGDYLSIATSTAFGFGTGDFTIEFWAYSTSTSRQDWVDISDGTNRVLFYYTGSAVTFYGNGVTAITGAALVTNAWVHYALVKSSGSTKLYVNGTQAGSTYATNQNYGTTAAVSIGKDMFGSTYITGNLSNFRIVKGTAVYTTAFTPPTAPLTAIANTSLLTCQSPTIVDNSSNAFALTGFGNVIQKPFHPFGTTSYSQYFDGNGDYLTVPASSGFAFGTSDFTVEGWVYVTGHSGSGANGIFQQGTTSFPLTTTNSVAFGTVSSGQVWQIYAKNTNANSSVAWAFNTWYHFAVVRNSNTTSLYINGTSVITVASDNTDYTGNYFGIGSIYGTGYCQLGYISNLRVVKGTAVYTANFTPPTAPLTAISGTSLLTCQNLTAIDNSANAFTITKNGDVSGSLSNPFPANAYTTTTTDTAYTPALYGGSAYFDGTGDYLSAPSLVSAPGDFTLECWFNTTIAVSGFRMLCGGNIDASASNYLGINASGVEAQFGSGSATVVTAAYTFVPNTWYHVAMTRSGTTIRIFVNGVSLTTSQGSQAGTFAIRYVAIGYNGITYTGYMADLRFVIGQALYTGGFVPPIAPLQAVKNTVLLLNMDKSGITDSSRCVDLETVGDAKIRYESPYSGSYYSNYFADTSSYFSYAPASSDAFGTGDFTVECWLNPTSTTAVNISIASATTSTWQFLTYGSQLYWQENGGNLGGAGYGTIASNVWSHVAVSRAGTTLRMFINGVQVYSVTNSYNYSVSPSARSVGPYNGGSAPAYISNFRVVKGTAVYTAAFTPSTTPLTAVSGTSLLTCQSKSFVDNSSNNFTITRNGDVAVRSLNPFQANIANSSMYFDGTGDYLSSPTNPNFALAATEDYTVECWINFSVVQTCAFFQATNNISSASGQFWFGYEGGALKSSQHGSGTYAVSYTWAPSTGVWYHVAAVRASGTVRLFVNGVVVTTNTTAQNGIAFTQSGAAVGVLTTPAYFYGYLADLRFTKSARYTANFTPPTAPLPTS